MLSFGAGATASIANVQKLFKSSKYVGSIKEISPGSNSLIVDINSAKRNTGTTVLGHYPGYIELGNESGYRYFNIASDVWDKMTPGEQWAANVRFLERTIKKNDIIKLSTPFNEIRQNTSLSKEIEYLINKGYKASDDGMMLTPPNK